jgi:hypothetical protein
VKFVTDRSFADPEAAARKLLDIVRASIAESQLPFAYTGATNTAFTRAGGGVQEYSAGCGIRPGAAMVQDRSFRHAIELLADGAE